MFFHSFFTSGEKCTGGKHAKNRVTVLLCANATGNEKLQPLVIGKYKKPRCFAGLCVQNLPVTYEANTKSWMTGELFSKFCVNWDKKLKRKILRLLDNFPAHPQSIPNLTNIRLFFLPANTTSVIQPMDAGVIKNMKQFYRKEILKKQIQVLDTKTNFDINMKEVIFFISNAWKSVKMETIQNCFRHTEVMSNFGTEVVSADQDEDGTELIEILKSRMTDEIFDGGIEAYVEADNDLQTCELPTDDDIIAELLGKMV